MEKLLSVADSITPSLAEALRSSLQSQALLYIFKSFRVKTIEEVEKSLEINDRSLTLLREAESAFLTAIENGSSVSRLNLGQLPQVCVTLLYNLGYFLLLWAFIDMTLTQELKIDEWVKGIIGTLIGVLTAQLPDVNGYWFRSSASSAKKTEALALSKRT